MIEIGVDAQPGEVELALAGEVRPRLSELLLATFLRDAVAFGP